MADAFPALPAVRRLPNILAGEFLVPEFLQDRATPDNLSQAVIDFLYDNEEARARLEARFDELGHALRQSTADRAAQEILPLLPGA